MTDQSGERSLASRLLGWARREATPGDAERGTGPVVATKALGKFVRALAGRDAPSLLDLGPVVGSNVSFFGETLGCRLQVEDIYADVERAAATASFDTLPDFFATRFTHGPAAFDGILCWDLFDYLDKPSAQALAAALVPCLVPGGLLMGFFQTQANPVAAFTKYVIVDDTHLQYRTSPAAAARRSVFQNRDIERLFPGLTVTDSFLMLNRTREMLLRKRVPPATTPS